MPVLVTGGAGYIGSHLVLKLLDGGEAVVVLDNLSTGFDWAVPARAELIVADVGNRDLVQETTRRFGIDSIIHLAGSTVVSDSIADPLAYYRNNSVNSHALIEIAAACGVKHFIFSSTAAVYGRAASSRPITEEVLPQPDSPYGRSKLITEMMLRDATTSLGMKHMILRYFNVAGADPELRAGQSTTTATHLIKTAVEVALGKKDHLNIFGNDYPTPDGTCIRDYIHVSDLADAHALGLARLRNGGASMTVNCGYGTGQSVLDVIRTTERVIGREMPKRLSTRRAGDLASVIADASLARSELGWRPQFESLETIIQHAIGWERKLAERSSF